MSQVNNTQNVPQSELNFALQVYKTLGLHPIFAPTKRFGAASKHGLIFNTVGHKIIKIGNWTKNSQYEMNVAKRAGNAGLGPRVYNTRKFTNLGKNWAVMTMDKVPNPKTLYNAINNGTVTNFKLIQNVYNSLHRAGIHHGNLHGYNILVFINKNGQKKLLPINFGTAVYNKRIKNTKTAVNIATQNTRSYKTNGGGTAYIRPERAQPFRANNEELKALKKYFNKYVVKKTGCFGKFCRR